MRTSELREIALGTVRVEMRRLGIDPVTASVEDAQDIMEEIAATKPKHAATAWFRKASQNQLKYFDRDFKRWQRGRLAR